MKRLIISALITCATASTAHALTTELPSVHGLVTKPGEPITSLWTGSYTGLNIGYGWSNPSVVYGAEYALPPVRRTGATGARWVLQSPLAMGFFGGAQLGYIHQILGTGIVIGAETDFQGSGMSGTSSGIGSRNYNGSYFPLITNRQSIDWFGTVRGRIGYAVVPSLLVFGTGGFAYGGGTSETNILYSDFKEIGGNSTSFGSTGWTVGGGVEWVLWNNWSMKTEYLYVNLGNAPNLQASQVCFCKGPFTPTIDAFIFNQSGGSNQFHTLRAGLNYHFNWANISFTGSY